MNILTLYIIHNDDEYTTYGAFILPYYGGDHVHHMTLHCQNIDNVDKSILYENRETAEKIAEKTAFPFH